MRSNEDNPSARQSRTTWGGFVIRPGSPSLIGTSSCHGSAGRWTGSPSASCRVRFRLGDFQAPFQRRPDPRPPEHTNKVSLPNEFEDGCGSLGQAATPRFPSPLIEAWTVLCRAPGVLRSHQRCRECLARFGIVIPVLAIVRFYRAYLD